MHLWFQRKDLVEKVNRILADWYGEVVGDARTPEEDPLEKRKTTLARHFGFFPTPKAAAEELLSKVSLYRKADAPPLRILEPSAGTGALAYPLAAPREDTERRHREPDIRRTYRNLVDCIEIQQQHAEALERSGRFNRVVCGDFLAMPVIPQYDRVVMNPPFDLERDVDHVTQALKWLKPDGELHAIMAAGVIFRSTKKATAFRALIERMNGEFRDLPAGSFASQGTNVNTVILRVRKDGQKRWW
jgi:predicted RNA methylase